MLYHQKIRGVFECLQGDAVLGINVEMGLSFNQVETGAVVTEVEIFIVSIFPKSTQFIGKKELACEFQLLSSSVVNPNTTQRWERIPCGPGIFEETMC